MPFKKQHPLYCIFHSMKERCRNRNFKQWSRYGGRGIKVCDRWLQPKTGFHNFLSDMGPRPDGFTLDRIDNDGDYTPINCRWTSRKDQQRNQSVTRKITVDGKTYVAAALSEQFGLKTDTIIERSNKGLSFSEITASSRRIHKEGLALGGAANGERQRNKTHCKNGHPYNKENTYFSKEGWRRCRACHCENERARRLNH